MKQLTLLLLASLGVTACNPPTAPQASTTPTCDPNGGGESIFGYVPPCFNGPGQPPQPSSISLTSVTVAPTQVRAGDPFTVSAMAVFSCGGAAGEFMVTYAGVISPPIPTDPKAADARLTLGLTAVFGDTLVTVNATCLLMLGIATQTVTIQVLPAP